MLSPLKQHLIHLQVMFMLKLLKGTGLYLPGTKQPAPSAHPFNMLSLQSNVETVPTLQLIQTSHVYTSV